MSERHLPDALSVAPSYPDRDLALELVRVTEAAAMAAGRWVGKGDKNGADGVAVTCHARADLHRRHARHSRDRRGREGQRPSGC